MFDRDIVIVGGGPSGLSAGTLLGAAGYRVLLLEQEDFGGKLKKVEWFNDHPDYPGGIAGPELAERMIRQATAGNLELVLGQVEDIESYSSCKCVTCVDGRNYTCAGIILAGGRYGKSLDISGAREYLGRGVIDCVLCDAGLYQDRTVVVCGGGDAGVIEALTMSRFASQVIIIEQQASLTAQPELARRAVAADKIDIICRTTLVAVSGIEYVQTVTLRNLDDESLSTQPVDGVIVDVGVIPATDYLDGLIDLDVDGSVITGRNLETSVAGIVAVGDVRSGSAMSLPAAIADGVSAAQQIQQILLDNAGQ